MRVMNLCMIEGYCFRQEDRRTRILFFYLSRSFFYLPQMAQMTLITSFFLCAILTASKGALRIFTDLDSLCSLFFLDRKTGGYVLFSDEVHGVPWFGGWATWGWGGVGGFEVPCHVASKGAHGL